MPTQDTNESIQTVKEIQTLKDLTSAMTDRVSGENFRLTAMGNA